MIEIYGLSWDMVSEIDLARIKKLPRPQLSQVKRLEIYENYLGAKHGGMSTVLDLDKKALVSVTKGRGKTALDQFFSTLTRSKSQVEAVATDMASGYIAAVEKHLPHVALVFDPVFNNIIRHVMKLVDEKLSDLRREMYNELADKLNNKVLDGWRCSCS